MATYYLEAYDKIHIGRKASKFDLQCLDCYHETPIFNADPELGEREIIISAVKKFCEGQEDFRFTDFYRLVRIK